MRRSRQVSRWGSTDVDTLRRLVHAIEALNEWTGRLVAWLTLGCVATCFAVVVLRYAFGVGYPWMQELYVWQHAIVFMVGAGYTMLHRGHVNVDVVYGRLGERGRAWLDVFGTLLFLFPWLAVLAVTSAPFVLASWRIRETSNTSDGMPAVYLLKSVIWVFCLLLFLQGLVVLVRRVALLAGRPLPDPEYGKVTDERP